MVSIVTRFMVYVRFFFEVVCIGARYLIANFSLVV